MAGDDGKAIAQLLICSAPLGTQSCGCLLEGTILVLFERKPNGKQSFWRSPRERRSLVIKTTPPFEDTLGGPETFDTAQTHSPRDTPPWLARFGASL